ncbi:MAG: Ig-like domain-containing protein [Marmoricola sp.]
MTTFRTGRPRRIRVVAAALVLATAATTGLVLAQGASAADPSVPPWQTGTGTGFAKSDPHAVGTLSFYNASGQQVFGGSTTSASGLAAYVQASGVIRAGDTRAALYAYTPSSGSYVGSWSGGLLTAAVAFPATPPGSVSATLPVYPGTAGDTKLSDFIAAYPETDAASGYSGVYEIRLRTSKPGGETASDDYAVADIQVTGTTWQVFGSKVDATGITATVPTTAAYGAGFDVPVTLTGGGATPTGTVTLKEGATAIGAAVPLSSGAATIHVAGAALSGGSHSLTVSYSGDTTYNSGASTASPITITKVGSSVTSVVPAKATYGTAYKVTATVTGPAGTTATGTATLASGTTTISTVALAAGKATFTVPGTKLAPGSRPFVVTYNGSSSLETSSSVSHSTVVGRAVGHAVNAVSPKTISHTKAARLTVKVTATGVVGPTGVISIYDGTRLIKRVTLTAARKGVVVVVLPKLRKGKHVLHAVYGGSALVSPAAAAKVTLKST